MNFFKAIFGSKNDRDVKKIRPVVARINELEAGLQKLSDDELRGKTAVWREELSKIEDKDELARKLQANPDLPSTWDNLVPNSDVPFPIFVTEMAAALRSAIIPAKLVVRLLSPTVNVTGVEATPLVTMPTQFSA